MARLNVSRPTDRSRVIGWRKSPKDWRWAVLSDFMTLRPNEAAYIASIERGELCPELLFPDDPEAAKRIAEHPAILWKITNVRSHLARHNKEHINTVLSI